MGRLALVLSGGGARGAYEAGVLHYIRTALPRRYARKTFDIKCGSSSGAINIATLASMAEDPLRQGIQIKKLWMELRTEQVYKRDFFTAARFLSFSVRGIFRNLTTINPFNLSQKKGPHFYSLLDSSPLKSHLDRIIQWKQLEKNVEQGPLSAVSISVTNSLSGRSELFLTKKPEIVYTGTYRVHEEPIKSEHVMASASIPLVFPSVKINKTYYTDGGLRLFTPMSPAIQLGAERVVVVGLRHPATAEEIEKYDTQEMIHPPSAAQLAGRLLNMIFLDRVQFDLEQLERINSIIKWSEEIYGKDYLDKINNYLMHMRMKGDIADRGLRKIQVVEILPSQFISKIFEQWFNKLRKGTYKLSALEKLLMRLLDVDTGGALELLSYLTFTKEYLKDLIDLGYEDAKENHYRLIELFDQE